MKKIGIQKIHMRKRTLPEWLTCYIFVMPFLMALCLDFLGLPGMLKYTVDVAWVGILVIMFRKKKLRIRRVLLPLVYLSLGFFLLTLLVYGFHFQSAVYYLWGMRNNFRFYVAFFAFAEFFHEDDVSTCFKLMDVLFWINILVSLYQFAVLGYKQDYLGGIFGVEKGSNAYTNFFFCILLSRYVLSMMNGESKTMFCLVRCAAALIVASLAELYAFYLFFILILVLATVLTKFSWKKCFLLIAVAFLISVGSMILATLFGEGSQLTVEVVMKRLFSENYASTEDLGRLTAIPTIAETILTDVPSKLFGLGLGNCDTATFAICNTPFYQSYSQLHYTWFSSAFLFLETGYVGLTMYLLFFVICLICAVRHIQKKDRNLLLCQISAITAVLCIVFTFYNSGLRSESGYMIYFALSLVFTRPASTGKELTAEQEIDGLHEKGGNQILWQKAQSI